MKTALRIILYVLVSAVLIAGSTYVSYKVFINRIAVEVPNLTGMGIVEAQSALDSRDLSLEIESEDYDANIPAGHVINQEPQPGTHVRGKSEVKVVLSRGPAVRLIPRVAGKKVDEARREFAEKGLDARFISVRSNTIEADTVIAQRPEPEEWAGQSITIIASAGPYNVIYYCPTFVGLTKKDALAVAEELGLKAAVKSEQAGADVVAKQRPRPGAAVKEGDTVYLELMR